MSVLGYLLPVTAAALCVWGAWAALPSGSVPWPSWVSWVAMAVAFSSYSLWFNLATRVLGRASKLRHKLFRAPAYVVTFVVSALAVSFVPLLPAYGLFGLCRLGLDCQMNAQGAFNVLHAAAFELKIWVSVPICIAFTCVAVFLARRLYSSQSRAQPILQADA